MLVYKGLTHSEVHSHSLEHPLRRGYSLVLHLIPHQELHKEVTFHGGSHIDREVELLERRDGVGEEGGLEVDQFGVAAGDVHILHGVGARKILHTNGSLAVFGELEGVVLQLVGLKDQIQRASS